MREIDGRKAITKLITIQLELRKIQQACMIMEYKDMTPIISGIQDIKMKVAKQYPDLANDNPIFVDHKLV